MSKQYRFIFSVKTERDYDSLMEHLETQGITWWGLGTKPTECRYEPVTDYIYLVSIGDELTYAPDIDETYRILGIDERSVLCWTKAPVLPTLAEFLGWKEDTIYESDGDLYKIKEGRLLSKQKGSTFDWAPSNRKLNTCGSLRNEAKIVDRYMLASKLSRNSFTQYVTKCEDDVFFDSLVVNPESQIFTLEEATRLIEEYHLENVVELKRV